MKKSYKPLNMLMNSRYKVLFQKLADEEKTMVVGRMAELIEEECEYADRGNYGHLCNILSTIALDEVLQQTGRTPEASFKLISTHMWAALKPEGMQKLARLPFFMWLAKKVVPLGFKYGSGKGWRYIWHLDTDGPKEFHFECNECLYKYEFGKRGLLERFGPMFCHSDIINYGNLPYTDFIRTQTLCQGGELCDFCFIRHPKDESWERTKSI